MLAAAEEAALSRGYRQVGLGVAVDNVGARALYERLGYRDLGFETYTLTYPAIAGDGRERTVVEEVIYLVKDLRESASSSD